MGRQPGFRHSEETKRKISEAKRGEKNPFFGKKHSLKTRQKMSENHQGRKNPFWGKCHSLEVRQKISEAHKGRTFTLEHRQKIADAQRGKKSHNWGKFGEKAPHWKGGRKHVNNYIFLLNPDHPNADCNGYIKEHRWIMAKFLGRPLGPREVIHHINGDPSDNRIKNLILFPSQAEHVTFHNSERRKCQQ